MKCPLCKGTGKAPPKFAAKKFDASTKKRVAQIMHGDGYSYREIAKACGWKSPRSAYLAANGGSDET